MAHTCAKWDFPSGDDYADPAQVSTAPGLDDTPRTTTVALTLSKPYQRMSRRGRRLEERPKKGHGSRPAPPRGGD